MYVDQLITSQPLNRPDELEKLHLSKMMLLVLLNDGRVGEGWENSMWYTKQGDLMTPKRKPLKTSLWMRPDNLPADIVQRGGRSVEAVRNVMHGLVVQYDVGEHSLERVDFLTFEDRQHPAETAEQSTLRHRNNLKERIRVMINVMRLL